MSEFMDNIPGIAGIAVFVLIFAVYAYLKARKHRNWLIANGFPDDVITEAGRKTARLTVVIKYTGFVVLGSLIAIPFADRNHAAAIQKNQGITNEAKTACRQSVEAFRANAPAITVPGAAPLSPTWAIVFDDSLISGKGEEYLQYRLTGVAQSLRCIFKEGMLSAHESLSDSDPNLTWSVDDERMYTCRTVSKGWSRAQWLRESQAGNTEWYSYSCPK